MTGEAKKLVLANLLAIRASVARLENSIFISVPMS